MLVRGLIVLAFFSTATAFAAPVPKSLKASNRMATARFKVSYKNASFDQVLSDFAEETGLKWVGDRPDLGTISLNLIGREYSGVEYLDLLNEVLRGKDYTHFLVRHAGTFYLHPTNRPVDLEKVDTVTVEDIIPPKKAAPPPAEQPAVNWGTGDGWGGNNPWAGAGQFKAVQEEPPKRGKTEVAALVFELPTGVKWPDVHTFITKQLSTLGQIEFAEHGNEIRITDRVGNLRTVAYVLVLGK